MFQIRVAMVALLLIGWGQGEAQQTGEPVFTGEQGGRLSTGDVMFGIDFAAFRGPEGRSREELYFQLHADQLSFLEGHSSHRATFEVGLTLFHASGDTALQQAWKRLVAVQTQAETGKSNAILDVFQFDVAPGRYSVSVQVTDLDSQKKGVYTGPLVVPAFEGLSVSQIQFASQLSAAGQAAAFVKNGVQVDPNVTRSFATTDSLLHFYYECYGLDTAKDPSSASVAYSIVNADNIPVRSASKRFRTSGGSFVRAESLDLVGVPAGRYRLRVQVRDDGSRQLAQSERPFEVQQPLAVQMLATDEGALERYYDQIKYIATPEELGTYKDLPPQEKVAFYVEFWKRRDPTPETPINEFAQEHFRRINYANNRFVPIGGKHKQKQGMDTDMGRIYIKFGPPDEIEDQLNPSATSGGGFSDVGFDVDVGSGGLGDKPVQIWYYERMGNYTFIFRDRYGLGVYELVHSTYPGERYDPDWRRRQ